jgi:hypothetical protein
MLSTTTTAATTKKPTTTTTKQQHERNAHLVLGDDAQKVQLELDQRKVIPAGRRQRSQHALDDTEHHTAIHDGKQIPIRTQMRKRALKITTKNSTCSIDS